MNDTMTVAQKLKEIRTRSGLSVRRLAEALKMPASSYQHYESQKYTKRYLDAELCSDLADVFKDKGVPPAEIMALAGLRGFEVQTGDSTVISSDPAGFEVLSPRPSELHESSTPYTVGVDVEKLQAVAQAVEELTEEMEIPIDPARKGKMIARLYNLLYENK